MPPKKLTTISTESKGALRGIAYDEAGRRLFACCLDDGKVYGYYLGSNIQADIEAEKLFTIVGEKGCRDIVYVPRTEQIVVGHDSGIVAVYNVSQPKAPFYSRKVHNKDITKMEYLPDCNVLLTASKDQSVKFWKIKHDKGELPRPTQQPKIGNNPFQNLEDDEDDPFAKNSYKPALSSKNTEVVVNTQKTAPQEKEEVIVKSEKDEDSEDELAGWND